MADRGSRAPNAASAVVLRRDGRVLLVQRDRPPLEGVWTLPGGRIEPGESSEVAAAREVSEETGLAIVVGTRVADVEVASYVIAVHAAKLAALHDDDALDEAVPTDDARALTWATDDDLARLGVPPSTADAIARARELSWTKT